MAKYDVIVLGSGPGGYTAAIRASQLGKSVAIIEKDKLGGVCLNRGCIPTKALIKSAHVLEEFNSFKSLGINAELISFDSEVAVKRANKIASGISKGVSFLMKKNNIEVINGHGVIKSRHSVEVETSDSDKETKTFEFDYLIVATGAHYKTFPGLEHDGQKLIGSTGALKLEKLPKSMGIIGAGAIGVEFAYIWKSFGVDIHIFELQNNLLPNEDTESCLEIERSFKRKKIKMSLGLEKVSAKNDGEKAIISSIEKNGETKDHQFDMALIAVGMTGNIDNIGPESLGIKTERGHIQTNDFGQTNIPNIYAIGDVSGGYLLAHAASHEGIIAAEHISGKTPHPMKPLNIPRCTYSYPQVASIGYTEKELKEKNIEYSAGKLPFRANGKAQASNEFSGHTKVLIGKDGELLGAHIVGDLATELIHELSVFTELEGVDESMMNIIHAHPTLGESIAEAFMVAKNRPLNF